MIVIGAGVIGLLTARMLSEMGVPVLLLERQRVGEEASWAGGGIVSPLYPWNYAPAVSALAHWSQDFYPGAMVALQRESGIDPELHQTGLYWLDLSDEEKALAWAHEHGRELRRATMREVCAQIPQLRPGYRGALYMPGVANVRNPRLLRALRSTLEKCSHVEVREQCSVLELLVTDGCVRGVRLADGVLKADQVVVAAGAWSGGVLDGLRLHLPVEPVKGQMILYKCAPGFLPAMVLAGRRYAIPRRDGHILVGSTLEHAGFDKTPTEEALASLRRTAEELLPALADAPVVGHWAGLRPGSPEGIPFIGEVPGVEGLWLNCGHYRNGLVMAPASCRLLVDLMLGRAPIVDPAPYDPAGRLG